MTPVFLFREKGDEKRPILGQGTREKPPAQKHSIQPTN